MKLTSEQERQRATWQYRAVEATRGNQSLLGLIVLATLAKSASNPPKITGSATITKDGHVLAAFQGRDDPAPRPLTHICTVEELQSNFSGLADSLKLNDLDRVAMFTELKKWIWKDERADTMLHFKTGG